MKRLTCKSQFKQKILSGQKSCTARARQLTLKPGDRFAFVCRSEARPAFLVPAADGFANGIIKSVREVWVYQLIHEVEKDPSKFGFETLDQAEAFYAPRLPPGGGVWIYEWELEEANK